MYRLAAIIILTSPPDKDHGDSFVMVGARVAELGRRFYPSEIAYPLGT